DFQVAQLRVHLKAAGLTEKTLHRVVEPAWRQSLALADRLSGVAEFSGRNEQGVDILGGLTRVENQAHDCSSSKKQLTANALLGEFFVEDLEKLTDPRRC